MSNRFDSALLSREMNRQKLAEVLEEKYASERRKSSFVRLGIVGAVVLIAAVGLRNGFSSPVDFAAVANTQKKLQDRKKIMEEIEKQMESGDQMMIGGGASAPEKADRGIPRSNGDADSYGNEKVPLNLVGEVRQKRRRQTGLQEGANSSLQYGAKGPGRGEERDQELESLRSRRAKRVPADYGKYRPATPAESAKNPLPARRQQHIANPDLYVRLSAPSPRLAADVGAFPDLGKK